jgi:cyclic beta-1,2-glucan synthetase
VERFESNHRFIAAAYQTIADAVRHGDAISSAAEWVIDNYHIIEEQLREIREDLPRRFYDELPKLEHGNWAGFPRIYDLAHELVVHTDSSLNQDLIVSFVQAYQRTADLTSGEIWAIPIMLRLVLVENLRRLCAHILVSRDLREQAATISRLWLSEQSTAGGAPLPLESPTLVVHLLDCLRESNPERSGVCLAEVAQRFGQPHEAVDELVRLEHQRQAADQVSVGNIITSMQLLSGLDWKSFFEQVSPIERILRQDPAGVYAEMDFGTRDQYRHEVERIAKRCRICETKVASAAIGCANEADRREETDLRRRHVGYTLIDDGRAELESLLGYRLRFHEWTTRLIRRHAELFYLGGIWLLTLAGVAWVAAAVAMQETAGKTVWLAGLLALVPASEFAVTLINVAVTHLLKPRALPKLEFVDGVPTRFQTLVVIPTLLTSEKSLHAHIERLEIHYLANPEPGLQFALLTDFTDARQEEMPVDAPLLARARTAIADLNARYTGPEGERFLLLHRPREWNPMQQVWMGWERKRGKLLELNRLLRGARDTLFLDADKAIERLRGIKYVITLDADTRLPHGAAKRLIGTLAHPLNRAQFDTARGRVVRGYGLLQPRVSVSLTNVGRSLFARFCANSPGLDPYCTAVSDVYQDLFGEGSYIGKAIYEVDAFASAVDDTFPVNQILSHDLIEGCFVRVGLATDIELFDEFPTRHDADARRQHRWVRGDWQLLPWLLPTVPTSTGRRPNHLSLVSRWKIFDNLRRSLVAPTVCLGLLTAWLLAPALATDATVLAILVLAAPLFAQSLSVLASWPQGVDWRRHLRDVVRDLARTAVQCALVVVFLPYRAWLMTDAIVRTSYRLLSRQHLLEWETADTAERRLKTDRYSSVREMGWISLLTVVVLVCLPSPAYPAATPILLAWLLSPVVGHWISLPAKQEEGPLSRDDRQLLRGIARKTWAFFEEFVGEPDHWLPPDNYQEYPREKIAHRTSPTNAGLYIVAALTARDFGYCSVHDLLIRLERNLETLDRLDRFHGHFLNWYDTETLEALPPRYVSTADSGNMAASLIAAVQGLRDVARFPLLGDFLTDGLLDAVGMVEESLARFQPRGARLGGDSLTEFEKCLAELKQAALVPAANLSAWARLIRRTRNLGECLCSRFATLQSVLGIRIPDLSKKMELLSVQIAGWQQDAKDFLPWLDLVATVSDAGHTAEREIPAEVSWLTNPSSCAAWNALWGELSSNCSIDRLAQFSEWGAPCLRNLRDTLVAGNGLSAGALQLDELASLLAVAADQAARCRQRLDRLETRYAALAMETDFRFTYNPQRRLFSVGYNLDESRTDRAHYDLLASESRLASQVAIAKGDVDHRHWFQLGRMLTEVEGTKSLLSWGGTMFEFLMPTLFARDFQDSLLDQSCRAAVKRQIAFGRQAQIPWGISESAYGAQAANSDYHYQSFGVPGLGLKRGLAKDLVISPYSTALAALLAPDLAAANFRALAADGAAGEWGFYDAVDYTPSRRAADRRLQLHGPPSGHDTGRAGELPARPPPAAPLPGATAHSLH